MRTRSDQNEGRWGGVFEIGRFGGMLSGMTISRRSLSILPILLGVLGCQSAPEPSDGEEPATAEAVATGTAPMTLVILRSGPAADLEDEARAELLRGHHAQRIALAEAGRLLLAGPFDGSRTMPDRSLRGLYVFDTGNLEEARAWADSDPSVAGGLFHADLLPMDGPVALRRVNELHVALVERLPAEQRENLAAGIAQYTVAFGRAPGAVLPEGADVGDVVVRARLHDGRDVAIFSEIDVTAVSTRLGQAFAVHPWASTSALQDLGAEGQSG